MSNDVTDVETFRHRARAWLEDNLDRRDPAQRTSRMRGVDHKTVEGIAEERKIQRKLYDGGFAGITFPKEYGGLGLTQAHQRAFNEEATGYRTPDFGIAGGTTFGVCCGTLLAHGSPEFLTRHIPKVLAGDELWVQFFSEPEAG